MNQKTNVSQPITKKPPLHEKAFEWPRQAMREQNWREAALRWKVLRQAYPEHPATWLQGANAHIEAGDFEQAEILLTHARLEYPEHPLTLTESALLAMHQKEWDIADNYLQQARQKHPDIVQTWLKSAECAEGSGELKQATKYSERACQCNPDLPGPYIQYAELAMRNEQWEQAMERWKKLRSDFPKIPAGYQRAADAARHLNRPKEARQLILTHQYGADILDSETNNQNTTKQHGDHTNIGRLLELIWTKALFNLRSEVHRNYLSYGWWVLEPLLHMGIYYLVFGFLLQRGGENYSVFLLSGLIPWMWFTKAVSVSSNSIIAGQNLMLQVGLPSIVFPLVSLLQASIKQIPVFILLFGFLWLQDFTPGVHWWALIPVIAVQALLTIAIASAAAAVIPFARDLSYLVPTGLMFLMFLSGIFYDYTMISPDWQDLFLMNPMAFLLKCYREIFISGILPDMQVLALWGLASAAACIALIFAYKRLRYIYPRVVME